MSGMAYYVKMKNNEQHVELYDKKALMIGNTWFTKVTNID